MRTSIGLCVLVIGLFSLGCSSQSGPLPDGTATSPAQPIAASIQPPDWETDVDANRDTAKLALANDPAAMVDELDLSDLDEVAPRFVPPAASRAQASVASKSGNRGYQDDLSRAKPPLPIASRDARGPASPSPTSLRSSAIDSSLPAKVELREARKRDLDQIIESYYGKVVFVDFWASWCGPCVGSFPQTVRMHRLAHDHDLRVITVSLDKAVNQKTVLRFLKSHQATCVNLLAMTSGLQPVSYEFGIPGGSIPHFKLYDRRGTKRHDWTGAGPDVSKDIIRRVVELLNET